MSDIPDTLAEAAAALRAGTVSSVELTLASIARADRLDEQLGTYLCRADDAALQAAKQADAELEAGHDRGPLHGIPVGVKDIVATVDLPTTAQSLVLDPRWGEREGRGGRRALACRRRRDHGEDHDHGVRDRAARPDQAIPDPSQPVGTRPMGRRIELGNRRTASPPASSWAGIGTDTGGSIRMPSALCGITGIKPTFGRVPKSGVVPLSWSFDHVGPMARTARDCALMLDVLAGHDPSDPLCAYVAIDPYAAGLDGSVAGLRIGVVRHHHVDAPFVDASAIAAFESTLAALDAAARKSKRSTCRPGTSSMRRACPIFMSEALTYHRRNLAERWEDYGSFTRQMITSALFYTAVDHVQAQRVRHFVASKVDDILSEVDVIATPTAGAGAPPSTTSTS